jgi:Fe-S cluster assembly protein SufD
VLGGAARGVFRGRVIVRPDAQKTSASQSNPNLLVGARAEIDTKPQLEIYADDVKCSHGSTIGRLDENALFYLRSRGLPEARARDLLLRAFALAVLERLPARALAEGLDDAVIACLRRAHGGAG